MTDKLMTDKCKERLRLDIFLCLYLCGDDTLGRLHQEIDLHSGVVLTIVKNRQTVKCSKLLKDVVLSECSFETLEHLTAKQHVTWLGIGQSRQQATIVHIHFESSIVGIEFQGTDGLFGSLHLIDESGINEPLQCHFKFTGPRSTGDIAILELLSLTGQLRGDRVPNHVDALRLSGSMFGHVILVCVENLMLYTTRFSRVVGSEKGVYCLGHPTSEVVLPEEVGEFLVKDAKGVKVKAVDGLTQSGPARGIKKFRESHGIHSQGVHLSHGI